MRATSRDSSKSAWSGSQVSRGANEQPIVRWLSTIIDATLALTIIVAPMFMGGRGPVGRCVFVALACTAAVAWFGRACFAEVKWRWSGVEWLILIGGMLVVVQLIPLPPSLLNRISPAIAELLPLWQGDSSLAANLGSWSTISLTPVDTRGGLATYLAYALLFLIVHQRLETIEDVEKLMKCLAIAAIVMASIGMLQLMFGNGKFLWIYEHPRRDTFVKVNGTFQNQNHFAHFLALGIGPLLWWLQRLWTNASAKTDFSAWSRKSNRFDFLSRAGLAMGLATVVIASLLTYSRGGVAAVAVVVGLTVPIYCWKSLLGRKSLIGLVAFGGLIAAALSIYGHDMLSAKLNSLMSGSVEEMSKARIDLWRADFKAIRLFPILGTGVGSHRDVYPLFMAKHYNGVFTHAENGYVQLVLETGCCGLVLGMTAFAIALRWCASVLMGPDSNKRLVSVCGAILPAGIASLVHACGDFAWYIPACMTLTILLAAIACRTFQLSRLPRGSQRSERLSGSLEAAPVLSRYVAAALTVLVLLLSIVAIDNRIGPAMAAPHADACLRLETDRIDFSAERVDGNRQKLALLEENLVRITEREPDNARALLDLAQICLTRFELEQQFSANPMILSQIRDAALASSFPSREAQDAWLNIAIGENRRWIDVALQSCKKAVALSPLQGHGYVHLADLCFLETSRVASKEQLIGQAARVRPHSGLVQFALGKEAAMKSDFDAAIVHWRLAFQHDPMLRKPIIEKVAAWMPANEVLNTFEPDSQTLGELATLYRSLNRLDDVRFVAEKQCEAMVHESKSAKGDEAAAMLASAAGILAELDKLDSAIALQQRAVDLSPNHFEMRRSLALFLARAGRVDEGLGHMEWCARRRPEDTQLQEDLEHMKVRLARHDEVEARLDR